MSDTSLEDLPLTYHLKQSTQTQHTRIEQHPFVTSILNAKITAKQYLNFLSQIEKVYEILDHQVVKLGGDEILKQKLKRTKAIRKDIEWFSEMTRNQQIALEEARLNLSTIDEDVQSFYSVEEAELEMEAASQVKSDNQPIIAVLHSTSQSKLGDTFNSFLERMVHTSNVEMLQNMEEIDLLERHALSDIADVSDTIAQSNVFPSTEATPREDQQVYLIESYVSRLQYILDTKQWHLMLAHIYVRYLGDLSGGQFLARKIRARFHLGNECASKGIAFYIFDGVVEQLKDDLRESINSTMLSDIERGRHSNRTSSYLILHISNIESEECVSEADLAFRLNYILFEDAMQ